MVELFGSRCLEHVLENQTISAKVLLWGFPTLRQNLNWTDIWPYSPLLL